MASRVSNFIGLGLVLASQAGSSPVSHHTRNAIWLRLG